MRDRSSVHRFAVCLLVLPLLGAGTTWAADKGNFKLRFNTIPDSADTKETPLLRPNQTQDYYLFVQNLSDKGEQVTVEVFAGDKPVDGGVVTITAKANGITQVVLGKPVPVPAPGEKPTPPAPPAPPEKGPPALADLKGALKFVLHGTDAVGKRVDLDEVTPILAKPADYVEVVSAVYDLKEKPGIKNQLIVKVRAKQNFQGGACRVDLALKADRIPEFIDTPKKEGTRGGYLNNAGDELTLTANNLKFRDSEKGDERKSGLVYLTIDGYERAFLFRSTFPRGGVTESELDRESNPVVRLKAPLSANPEKPYPAAIELDNATSDAVLEIGLDRDADGKFNKKAGEITFLGSGNRQQLFFINAAFPNGALQLKTLVADWSTNLDVAGLFGPRTLRLRLLRGEAEAKKDRDEDRQLVPILNSTRDLKDTPVLEIVETVMFDATPPENIMFVDFPAKLLRGAPLPVKATAADPESGVKAALFYVGKPGPDGKPPANAPLVVGKLLDPKTGVWTASLDAPTEQKGLTDVTVQFTNGAGLVAVETVKIQLVDPGAEKPPAAGANAGPKVGSIAGKVVEGDRPQPKLPVFLRDAQGGVKDTVLTDDKGAFLFKDVQPASYRVAAGKTADSTKGETIVQVKEGEKKTDVEVKLVR